MKEVLEGSQGVAVAVRLARTQVISAYPITPQTHIVEELAKFCEDGSLDAKFICVESEHSAMASMIGAASAGARTFTATSSHGLAYMHEMLHWAAGARLPIVMAEVNRALGPGWNLWLDQTDSLSQRDTGWLQLFCEDNQEALDTTLQAFLLAEIVNLPVMVVLDAFFLSHTYEPVDVPDQAEVDRFLPPYQPKFLLDPARPCGLHELAGPAVYMEMRKSIQNAMDRVPEVYGRIQDEFAARFGRSYPPVEAYQCEDADVVLVMAGTTVSTCRAAVQALRARGERVGLLKLKMYRPFPAAQIVAALRGVPKVAVVDRNNSAGSGGIFAHDLQAAFCNLPERPLIYSYVAGIGGKDVTTDTLEEIYRRTLDAGTPGLDSEWIGINEELAKS